MSFGRRLGRRLFESNAAYPLLTFGVLAALWELGAAISPSLLIPGFVEFILALPRIFGDGDLWAAFLISNQAMIVGFTLSVILGVPLGMAMGRFRIFGLFADGYLTILLILPTAAIIPLVIMWVGLNFAARVILIVLPATVLLVIACRSGVRQADVSIIEMARSFGASERAIWWRVLIPNTVPAIMTGMRLSLARAIEGMVLVELLLVAVGLGNYVLVARGRFDGALLFGVIGLIIVESLLLAAAARWLERRAAPWAQRGGLSR